jgi:transposase InsO family protein
MRRVRPPKSASRAAALLRHPTGEGKLYLAAVKDACSTRIVGYSMGERMTAELACGAVRNAVTLRQPRQTVIVHSDRGGQFRSKKFTDLLNRYELNGSMGCVATCADNAAMESFFALLRRRRVSDAVRSHDGGWCRPRRRRVPVSDRTNRGNADVNVNGVYDTATIDAVRNMQRFGGSA